MSKNDFISHKEHVKADYFSFLKSGGVLGRGGGRWERFRERKELYSPKVDYPEKLPKGFIPQTPPHIPTGNKLRIDLTATND